MTKWKLKKCKLVDEKTFLIKTICKKFIFQINV